MGDSLASDACLPRVETRDARTLDDVRWTFPGSPVGPRSTGADKLMNIIRESELGLAAGSFARFERQVASAITAQTGQVGGGAFDAFPIQRRLFQTRGER